MFDINFNFIFAAINLFILYWALNKWFFKPVSKLLEERQSKIDSDLSSAEYEKQHAARLKQIIEI